MKAIRDLDPAVLGETASQIANHIIIALEELEEREKVPGKILVPMSKNRYQMFMNYIYMEPDAVRNDVARKLLQDVPGTLRRTNTANLSHQIANALGPVEYSLRVLSGEVDKKLPDYIK